jgi:diacylglycerol kinase family enzyme
VRGRLFLLRVDIGKIVEITEEIEREHKDMYGVLAYYYATGRTFFSDSDVQFRFVLDDERVIEREGAAFILLNLRRKTPNDIEANIQSGTLDFFIVRSNLWEAVRGITAFSGIGDTDDLFEVFSARKIRIESPEQYTVLADGEQCGETPLELELLPRAVSLVVPH